MNRYHIQINISLHSNLKKTKNGRFIILFFNEFIIDVSVFKNKKPWGATKECNKINKEIIRFFIRILINTVSSDIF